MWLSTDPLSGYNPVFEVEHYIDGQHNGGVFNSFNHNTYGYTYQNPVLYVDPNGKQVDITGQSTQSLSVYAGYDFSRAAAVRLGLYKPKVEALYQSHYLKGNHVAGSIERNKLIIESRQKLAPIGEAYSEMKKPTGSLKANAEGRYYKVNAGEVNNAKIAGAGGGILLTYGAYQSYQNVKSEGFTSASVAKEAWSWSGALIGGEVGGSYGVNIGSRFGPKGALVGSVTGGILGREGAEQTLGATDYGRPISLGEANTNLNRSSRASACNDQKCLR